MNTSPKLYSNDSFLLDSPQTFLKNDLIFTGNQPDDFGIAGYLTKGKKVLVIGLGFGSSIRSVLSSLPEAEITVVDVDSNIVNLTKSIYAYLFPNIEINYIVGDAQFIKHLTKEKYDLICVDVFTETGCPEFLCNRLFWDNLKSILKNQGVVITNTWGLPTHLNPLEGDFHQNFILNALSLVFKNNNILPYRRNITVISFEEGSKLEILQPNAVYLNEQDELLKRYLKFRLLFSKKLNIKGFSSHIDRKSLKHASVDKEMDLRHSKWKHNYLNKINESYSLKSLLTDESFAKSITIELLNSQSSSKDIIPNFMGSLAFDNDKRIDWYLKWIVSDYKDLYKMDSYWFVNVALCQFFSIIVNPYYLNKDNYVNEIKDILEFIENESQHRAFELNEC